MCAVTKSYGDFSCCTVEGRQDLIITFNKQTPEDYLHDKSLVGLFNALLSSSPSKPTRDLS